MDQGAGGVERVLKRPVGTNLFFLCFAMLPSRIFTAHCTHGVCTHSHTWQGHSPTDTHSTAWWHLSTLRRCKTERFACTRVWTRSPAVPKSRVRRNNEQKVFSQVPLRFVVNKQFYYTTRFCSLQRQGCLKCMYICIAIDMRVKDSSLCLPDIHNEPWSSKEPLRLITNFLIKLASLSFSLSMFA